MSDITPSAKRYRIPGYSVAYWRCYPDVVRERQDRLEREGLADEIANRVVAKLQRSA